MIKTITYPLATLFFVAALFFTLATTTFAYSNLEVEVEIENGETEVDVDYDNEDGNEVELEFTYNTTDLDEVYESVAADLAELDEDEFGDITAADIEDAVVKMENNEDEDENDEDEEENDEDEDDDNSYEDKNRGHGNNADRCDKDNRGRGCPMMKQAMKCRMDMLRDGERDRKFCRDGEWKEKREARLNDITSGFIKANDLSDEEAKAIRAEVEALIRQLITLMLTARLGN